MDWETYSINENDRTLVAHGEISPVKDDHDKEVLDGELRDSDGDVQRGSVGTSSPIQSNAVSTNRWRNRNIHLDNFGDKWCLIILLISEERRSRNYI